VDRLLGRLVRPPLSPDGECFGNDRAAVQRPTSCAFGGPDLDRLYVTSASIGLDETRLRCNLLPGGCLWSTPGCGDRRTCRLPAEDEKTPRRAVIANFMFATGIENSIPTINNGKTRVDQMEVCGHYERWREDFDCVQEIGINFLRYGPPLHKTFLGPGQI
jgi:hypothetical protein